MDHISISRRSRAYRSGSVGIDYLEVRKLLTVDYDPAVIPDINIDFDENNYTMVTLSTYEAHAADVVAGNAFAAPGEIEGGENFNEAALIAEIGDKRDALIAVVDGVILEKQKAITAFEKQRAALADKIAEDLTIIENPGDYTADEVEQAEINFLKRALADENARQSINQINAQILILNNLKYLINNTYNLMINSIIVTDQTMDPNFPVYLYSVATTPIVTS